MSSDYSLVWDDDHISTDSTDPRVWDDDYIDYDDTEHDYGYLSHLDDNAFVALTEHMDNKTLRALCRSSADMRHRCQTLVPDRVAPTVKSVMVYAMSKLTEALRPRADPWFVISYSRLMYQGHRLAEVMYGEKNGNLEYPVRFVLDDDWLVHYFNVELSPPCEPLVTALSDFEGLVNIFVQLEMMPDLSDKKVTVVQYIFTGYEITTDTDISEVTSINELQETFNSVLSALIVCAQNVERLRGESEVSLVPNNARLFDVSNIVKARSVISDTEPRWYQRGSQMSHSMELARRDPLVNEFRRQRPWMFGGAEPSTGRGHFSMAGRADNKRVDPFSAGTLLKQSKK